MRAVILSLLVLVGGLATGVLAHHRFAAGDSEHGLLALSIGVGICFALSLVAVYANAKSGLTWPAKITSAVLIFAAAFLLWNFSRSFANEPGMGIISNYVTMILWPSAIAMLLVKNKR